MTAAKKTPLEEISAQWEELLAQHDAAEASIRDEHSMIVMHDAQNAARLLAGEEIDDTSPVATVKRIKAAAKAALATLYQQTIEAVRDDSDRGWTPRMVDGYPADVVEYVTARYERRRQVLRESQESVEFDQELARINAKVNAAKMACEKRNAAKHDGMMGDLSGFNPRDCLTDAEVEFLDRVKGADVNPMGRGARGTTVQADLAAEDRERWRAEAAEAQRVRRADLGLEPVA